MESVEDFQKCILAGSEEDRYVNSCDASDCCLGVRNGSLIGTRTSLYEPRGKKQVIKCAWLWSHKILSSSHFSTLHSLIAQDVGKPLVIILHVKSILKRSSKRASCGKVSWTQPAYEKIQRRFTVSVSCQVIIDILLRRYRDKRPKLQYVHNIIGLSVMSFSQQHWMCICNKRTQNQCGTQN